MEILLVSACLLGENCKYNGGNNYTEKIEKLKELYDIIPICPETFGGLTSPRLPSEIKGDYVVNKEGKDVTKFFVKGAKDVRNIVNYTRAKLALLKENSPSCGVHSIYDGTFKHKVIKGSGITTRELLSLGVTCFNEHEIDQLIERKSK